jgi:hypothetical protein
VSDLDEYRELLQDPTVMKVWYFEPLGTLDGASEEAFQLTEVAVDGRAVRPRRTTRAGAQVDTVNLGAEAVADGRTMTISYTYRVLVQRHGHLLYLDVSRPTKGLRIQFSYGNCGIRYVNVLDYVASSRQPQVSRLPATEPTPSVAIGFDGWVLPKAGVAFVWVLEDEVGRRNASGRVQQQARR